MTDKPYPLPLWPGVKVHMQMSKDERNGKIIFSDGAFSDIAFVLKPIDKRGQIFEAAYMTTDDKPLLGYRLISRSLPGQPPSVVDVLHGLEIKSPTDIRCRPKRPVTQTHTAWVSSTRFVRPSAYTSLSQPTRQKRKEPTVVSMIGVLRFTNTCKAARVRKRTRTNLSSSST